MDFKPIQPDTHLQQVRTQLAQTFQPIVDKFSPHWSNRYFNWQLPLFSLLKEEEIAPKIAELAESDPSFWRDSLKYRLYSLIEKGTMQGKQDEGCKTYVQSIMSFAEKSTLAKDTAFMDYLAAFSEQTYESGKFGKYSAQDMAPAMFGYVATEYLPVLKVAKLNAFIQDLVKEADASELQEHLSALYQLPAGEEASPGQSKKNIEIVENFHLKAQGIHNRYIDYLQKNFGLVFVPQQCMEQFKGFLGAVHSEPAFTALHDDDRTVHFRFGVPFLPLAHAKRQTFLFEREAIVRGFEKLGDAFYNCRKQIQDISYLDGAVAKNIERTPFRFVEYEQSYAHLLLPVSRLFHAASYRLIKRDWSLPTFIVDEPLAQEFENLLQTRRHELASEVISEIELTIKILKLRRRLWDSFHEFEEELYRTCNPKPSAWSAILDAVKEELPKDAFAHVEDETHRLAIDYASLVLLGHPETAGKYAHKFNEAGIEQLIGYKLPESE